MKILNSICQLFTLAVLLVVFAIVTFKFSPNFIYVIAGYEVTQAEIFQIWNVLKFLFVLFVAALLVLVLWAVFELIQSYFQIHHSKKIQSEIKQKIQTLENLEKVLRETEKRLNIKLRNFDTQSVLLERKTNEAIGKLQFFQDSISRAIKELFVWINLKIEKIMAQLASTHPELLGVLQFIFGNQLANLGYPDKYEKFIYFVGTLIIFIVSILLKSEHIKFGYALGFIFFSNLLIWTMFAFRIYRNLKVDWIDWAYYGFSVLVFVALICETGRLWKKGAI